MRYFVLLFFLITTSGMKSQSSRWLRGIVTHNKVSLRNVNVQNIVNTDFLTVSDTEGMYKIQVNTGDKIIFSHLGFQSVQIVIEDVTDVLNIKMVLSNDQLAEVVISNDETNTTVLNRDKKKNREFQTAYGNINPKRAGFAHSFVDGDEIASYHLSLSVALNGKFAGYSIDPVSGKAYLRGRDMSINLDYPVLWDVDGYITKNEPLDLNLDNIRAVYVLKGLATVTRYGSLGAGGVIVVATKGGAYDHLQRTDKSNKNVFQNNEIYYDNDAIVLNPEVIFSDVEEFKNHPEKLKAKAYLNQYDQNNQEAISFYENVFNLRPQYAQSYRDLANAYIQVGQYHKAWKLYMSYAFHNNLSKEEGIGEIMYNEMEWLYYNRQAAAKITQRFVPSHSNKKEFERDIRIVFEWNTSEAEFDLEFVNPDQQVFTFEHTLAANEKLITDEKICGYSSKEFSIPEIDHRDWLINMTYFGNKKYDPTYFKVTTYYNWGRPNQTQKVRVFKLEETDVKYQLLKYNNNSVRINY